MVSVTLTFILFFFFFFCFIALLRLCFTRFLRAAWLDLIHCNKKNRTDWFSKSEFKTRILKSQIRVSVRAATPAGGAVYQRRTQRCVRTQSVSPAGFSVLPGMWKRCRPGRPENPVLLWFLRTGFHNPGMSEGWISAFTPVNMEMPSSTIKTSSITQQSAYLRRM